MKGIIQTGKDVVGFHFCLRWVQKVISKDFLCLLSASLSHWLPKLYSQQWIQYDFKKAFRLLLL